jgi:hypothetical protein
MIRRFLPHPARHRQRAALAAHLDLRGKYPAAVARTEADPLAVLLQHPQLAFPDRKIDGFVLAPPPGRGSRETVA